jgi:hypothetical protein
MGRIMLIRKRRPKFLEENLSQSQAVHQKLKVDWPRSNPGLRVGRSRLSHFQISLENPPVRRSHLMVGRQVATMIEESSVTLALLPG